MTVGSEPSARQMRAAHDKMLQDERKRRTALFVEVVEAAQATSPEKMDPKAITDCCARLLDRLSTVTVLAQKDVNVKRVLGKRTWSQAQQAFLQKGDPGLGGCPSDDVQRELLTPLTELESLLRTARQLSENPLALASLDMAWKCTTEALNGNYNRIKTIGALRTLAKHTLDRGPACGVSNSRSAPTPRTHSGQLDTPETREKSSVTAQEEA